MSATRLDALLRRVRQVVGPDGETGPTDGELLRRFVADRDGAAFEALVRRHGPMVLGVCRRALRDAHRAEDAFQATFLVLVRKAGSIRRRESVGSWLHGVARRVAVRARAQSERDSTCGGAAVERTAAAPTNGEALWELRPVLDDELQRLPERYRAPLVLHYLEGKTKQQAARELGWKEGTLSGRLARARELLRRRLTSRGLAPAVALALALPAALRAEVPAALAAAVGKAAPLAAAGEQALSAAVSSEVFHLMKGACRAMGSIKATVVKGVLMALALLGGGVGLAAYLPRGESDARPVWTPLNKEEEHVFRPISKDWVVEVCYLKPYGDPPQSFEGGKPEDYKQVSYFARAGDKWPCKFMRYYPSGALYQEADNYTAGDKLEEQFCRTYHPDGSVRDYKHWREGRYADGYSVSPDGKVRHRLRHGSGELVEYGVKEGNRVHRWYQEGAQFLEKRFEKGACVEVRLDILNRRGEHDDRFMVSRDREDLTLYSRGESWLKQAGRPVSRQIIKVNDDSAPLARDPEEEKLYLSRRDEFLKDYGDLLKKAGKSWKDLGIDFVRTGEKWPE